MEKVKGKVIKPKNDKQDNSNYKLIYAIATLLIGIILLSNSNKAVIFICYIFGGISLIIGIYNLIRFYMIKKELDYEDNNKMLLGILGIFLGLIFIFLASAIEAFLRFIIGALLLISGIKKSLKAIEFKFYNDLVIGLVCIAMGLYTILAQNVIFMLIGIVLTILGMQDLITAIIQKSVQKK